ncbi:glucose-1-phosphate cytidylyltransferase [Paenibacillus eucommiae]|uniref:Glucose-1-phosphate cytidylyltransferase n=1 Tax=Paenibacillus eucommiae TaxID=1355755 RepID=A0ABS4J710_9BACL|nr:glucose-1-phosphate cytidylyltransferase [Paenibacillus eucommiae]MBP1995593.1 glucose-1-phosphate cytidylyltransferase [Paenibacillus eucommiae]
MKVVILAGGYGTRISEESALRPKPMIEIGGRPMLWHIMKLYSHYGYNDFVICLGYKGNMIKDYYMNYFFYESDVSIHMADEGRCQIHQYEAEPWLVTLVNTGEDTMTGGRVKRIQKYIGDEPFMLTYGDGVSAINIKELVSYHQSHGKLATVTATQPTGRFGVLSLSDNGQVDSFKEKPKGEVGWVNAGFFVMSPKVFDYLGGDETVLEQEPLESLAQDGQLMGYKSTNFWHPMDTLRDKNYLEQLWKSGAAPWKMW